MAEYSISAMFQPLLHRSHDVANFLRVLHKMLCLDEQGCLPESSKSLFSIASRKLFRAGLFSPSVPIIDSTAA